MEIGMKLKAVFIDLDGTLADSIPRLYNFYQTLVESFGSQATPEEFNALNGKTISEIAFELKANHQWHITVTELVQVYEERLKEEYRRHIHPFPYAKSVLEHLHNKGIFLALVTSAKQELAKAFLEAHHLGIFFNALCTGENLSKGKPDPEIYQNALHSLNCEKDSICVIEDSTNGIQAAVAAGLHVLALNPSSLENAQVKRVADWKEIEQKLDASYD